VSSTETGVIFGNIVYEGGGVAERGVVVLADIHIDIMDYIAPASVADVAFRNMWAEFEWENKVRRGGAQGRGAGAAQRGNGPRHPVS
jgi:coatomer subunit beta